MKVLEQRSTAGVVQLRAVATGGQKIGGYALKWNTLSQNLGGFVERILPGAADKTIGDGGDVLCRYQHEDEFLLGRTDAGTLRLLIDNIGVDYDNDLPDTTYARDLSALVARGDVRYSSFAFRTMEDSWGFTEQGFPLRDLIAFQLVDVAPVVTPGYMDTSTGLRSLAEKRSLDLDVVRKAAEHNALGELLRSGDPVHIDLGARTPAPPAQRDLSCGCCGPCAGEVIGCPGCDCIDCIDCAGKGGDPDGDGAVDALDGAPTINAPRSNNETSETRTPGDTHGLITVRQRRAELYQRRTF